MKFVLNNLHISTFKKKKKREREFDQFDNTNTNKPLQNPTLFFRKHQRGKQTPKI